MKGSTEIAGIISRGHVPASRVDNRRVVIIQSNIAQTRNERKSGEGAEEEKVELEPHSEDNRGKRKARDHCHCE
jgi:hypothetical protein